MAPFPSMPRTSRNAALTLMLAVSAIALLACASDRASQDPSTGMRINFPFLGFDGTDGHSLVGQPTSTG